MGAIIDSFGSIGAGARAKWAAKCELTGGTFSVVEEETEGNWQDAMPFGPRVEDWILPFARGRVLELRGAGVNEYNNLELYNDEAVVVVARTQGFTTTWEPCDLYLLVYDELWV